MTTVQLALAGAQLLALLLLPIVMLGLVNRVKSIWAGRRGPRVLQPYHDMRRLLRKRPVYSSVSSEVFRLGPVVAVATGLVAGMLSPMLGPDSPLAFAGDFVAFAYVLALGRVFLMLAALDVGSAFEGMGAAREATYGAVIEPALFLVFGTLLLATGGASFAALLSWGDLGPFALGIKALCFVALMILLQIEAARIPVDDPMTHLELTMIHEVMILDHSGPDLAMLQYAAGLKITICAGLLATLLNPISWAAQPYLAAGVALGLTLAVAVLVGTIESLIARLRMRTLPAYAGVAVLASAIALVLVTLRTGGSL
ncbi:NADH-quinone oxidoreductase subunit H [Nannocystis sp.]|uniref:respiratory chain complex I subunit 1 family protein n=1 Tax=Nannocystis sp. TaxID=1962667 RepID=UPI0025DA650D|nr:NADH-quinone oxidoreductase subunit H [Nannocystis sp.]